MREAQAASQGSQGGVSLAAFLKPVLSLFHSARWSSTPVLLAKASPHSVMGPVHVSRSPRHRNTRQKRTVSGDHRKLPEEGTAGWGGLAWSSSALMPSTRHLSEPFSAPGARGSLGEFHSLFRDSYLNSLQLPVSATINKKKKS